MDPAPDACNMAGLGWLVGNACMHELLYWLVGEDGCARGRRASTGRHVRVLRAHALVSYRTPTASHASALHMRYVCSRHAPAGKLLLDLKQARDCVHSQHYTEFQCYSTCTPHTKITLFLHILCQKRRSSMSVGCSMALKSEVRELRFQPGRTAARLLCAVHCSCPACSTYAAALLACTGLPGYAARQLGSTAHTAAAAAKSPTTHSPGFNMLP